MPRLGVDFNELMTAWNKVRHSGQFTEGEFVRAFEQEVERWSGLHAIAVSSAGAGLFAMVRMSEHLGGNGGAVAVSNNTFFATGAMVRECQRQVVLVDCNRSDFAMSFEALESLRGPLSMVTVTHVGGGLAADYERIARWCEDRGLIFLEDAAHALGVGEAGSTAGALSDGAVFSLYPTKAIPAGEGGVILTKHAEFAERLREFRNYGKYVEDGVIRYRRSGFNLRMDEWTAAVSYLQMRRRAEIIALRETAAMRLSKVIPPMIMWGPGQSNWYKFPVLAISANQLGIRRFTGKVYQRSDQLVAALGINGRFPNSEWIADNHVCLPIDEHLYEGMSDEEILAWLRSAP